MNIKITVVSGRKDLRRFVRFPFQLYAGSEQWVPPIFRNELSTLDPKKNPAFEYCRARYWLAEKNGSVVGRIACIINTRYNEKWNQRTAKFSWVDFVDDPEVSGSLFAEAELWARNEGMSEIHGPFGFTGLDPEGFLVEGFEEMGTMTESYNYPYYAQHLESLGYRKQTGWVDYEVTTPESVPEKAIRVGRLALKRGGLQLVEAASMADLKPYIPDVFELLNEAYSPLFGYVELTPAQQAKYAKEFIQFIDPRFNKVVVDESNRLIAFGLTFPNLAEALQKARGRLFPFGFVHLSRALRNPGGLILGLIAVRPEYQGRGIPAILLSEITDAAIKAGITHAETGRELEDNVKVRSLWKSYDARQHKRRRAYVKQIS